MSVAAASLEVTVEPAAALALVASIVVIDLAAIRLGKWTISKFGRHQIREHPVASLTAALILGLHLAHEWPADPAGWLARRLDRSRR